MNNKNTLNSTIYYKKIVLLTIFLATILIAFFSSYNISKGFGEVKLPGIEYISSSSIANTNEYNQWLTKWITNNHLQSEKAVLTPGSNETSMNFCWYSTYPFSYIQISTDKEMNEDVKKVYGTSEQINKTDGYLFYQYSNKVTVNNLIPNTTYYYKVSEYNNISSFTTSVEQGKASSFVLIGDAQIGAGNNETDSFIFEKTMKKAKEIAVDNATTKASFIISVGDQINEKTDDLSVEREKQYCGFLNGINMLGLPIAAAIGNHDSEASDYDLHFSNPYENEVHGKTNAGSDYYFTAGNVLFIVLNSNNRNMDAHRKTLTNATTKYGNKLFRVAIFHHDIYGSGEYHSNKTSTNLRIVMAPLMDEFNIDLAINGHDHSYCRSYPMLDGTAIANDMSINPIGTTYICLGSSSISKMYNLASPKQFYVMERSNNILPTFSVLNVENNTLSIITYDYFGKKYASDFNITKTEQKTNPVLTIKKIKQLKKKDYTKKSFSKLKNSLDDFDKEFTPVKKDNGAKNISENYKTANDPLSLYGYKAGTLKAVNPGFSTLVDKTRNTPTIIDKNRLISIVNSCQKYANRLKKTSIKIYYNGKKIKKNTTINIKYKKRKKLKCKFFPKNNKPKFKSSAKKYVSISKKGILCALKKRKKSVKIKVFFENRIFKFKVKIQ